MASKLPASERTMITVPEAAELMGIGKTRAYELAARDELPAMVRIGTSAIRVHKPRLLRWLDEQAERSAQAAS